MDDTLEQLEQLVDTSVFGRRRPAHYDEVLTDDVVAFPDNRARIDAAEAEYEQHVADYWDTVHAEAAAIGAYVRPSTYIEEMVALWAAVKVFEGGPSLAIAWLIRTKRLGLLYRTILQAGVAELYAPGALPPVLPR